MDGKPHSMQVEARIIAWDTAKLKTIVPKPELNKIHTKYKTLHNECPRNTLLSHTQFWTEQSKPGRHKGTRSHIFKAN